MPYEPSTHPLAAPAFPALADVWGDAGNYAAGLWLNGRLGAMAGDELARAIAADFGVSLSEVEAALPFIHGYVVDQPMTARAALEPVLAASGLAVHDTVDGLAISGPRGNTPVVIDDVVAGDGPLTSRRRPDPGEAVGQVALSYFDRERNYLTGSVTAIGPQSGPLENVSARLVLDLGGARVTAERKSEAAAERLPQG